MIHFSPVWMTPSANLALTQETKVLDIPLVVDEVYKVFVEAGEGAVDVGEFASRVRLVEVGLDEVPLSISGTYVVWEPRNEPMIVTIHLWPDCTFSLLNGTLPPGIVLLPNGMITGTIGNIINFEPVLYDFTVRVTNGMATRDRRFNIVASSLDYPAYFDWSYLPDETYDHELKLGHRAIATFQRGDACSYSLSISDPDGVIPPLSISPVTWLPEGGSYHGGLPLGLKLDGNRILGNISAEAQGGLYLFYVNIHDPNSPTTLLFSITVQNEVEEEVHYPNEIVWDNAAGSLGYMYEGDPCYLTLSASATSGEPVIYFLAPGSPLLPPGLTLDLNTGMLQGVPEHVSQDRNFPFRIRAQSGQTFEDRDFALTIRSRYSKAVIYDLSLKMLVKDRIAFATPYPRVVQYEELFRPSDAYYGMVVDPRVYIVKGLDGEKDLETATAGDDTPVVDNSFNRDYHGQVKLILGSRKSAVARDDNGNVIYEVIYRELYDPAARAGGFAFGLNTPVEQKVIYPQSGVQAKYVYPISIRNMRYDLVRDIGFATNDASKKFVLGIDGVEGLPRWMTSEQIQGMPTSVIGYKAALVICYLKPGLADAVLDRIRESDNLFMPTGRTIPFIRYHKATDR